MELAHVALAKHLFSLAAMYIKRFYKVEPTETRFTPFEKIRENVLTNTFYKNKTLLICLLYW